MSEKKGKSYRDTLNLPKTGFSMKADLVRREPQLRAIWSKTNIYARIRKARAGAPLYILHDGPPYANGDIHMGHVINKVLKDFVVKYKTMTGFDVPFVPGWDCHGLPIESKVVGARKPLAVQGANKMSKMDIRRECMKYASKYVKVQAQQFQELGVFGDFENPYLTFKPQYEAGILEVFAELVDKGLVYKQLKPIHWSVGCETALAEAELEYKEVKSPSIFVNFPVARESIGRLVELGLVEASCVERSASCEKNTQYAIRNTQDEESASCDEASCVMREAYCERTTDDGRRTTDGGEASCVMREAYCEKEKTQDAIRNTQDEESGTKVCFMIWTTTPWTLAANLAVAVHPYLDYTALSYERTTDDGRRTTFVSLVATERVEAVVAAGGLQKGQYKVSDKKIKGRELEGLRYLHPFVIGNPTDKDAYMVICAEYVTTEDGTGLVHIAPGHGVEDYISGQKYGLAVYSPVTNDGRYDDTVPEWLRGKSVLEEADPVVISHLQEEGLLFAQDRIMHSYPHCWRSKMPVILRATEQWFISIDKELPDIGESLRDLSLERIKKVKWIPAWGQKRIEGMLESRPDWCISRQRSWGLPIPAFVNLQGEILMTKDSVLAVARHIGEKGSDSWFTDSPRQILGEDFRLPSGFDFNDLQKEENIFDVWFESGCSWYNVAQKAGWPVPVDLYLEGSDQHRGWFQLSLLPALGSIGREPFKSVLTHGFTVDEKGIKQSKSLGNYVNAQKEAAKYGSDILRLWVASVNYQEDVRCNDELIGRTQDAYRKIRNTLRYLLGNIDDFEPGKDAIDYERMFETDKWAMQQLQKLIANVTQAYENFIFHRVFSLIYNFCAVEMSSIYMDVLKDRMYCDGAGSLSRRSGQTAMYKILDCLVRMLAPILVHTAEETWAAIKFKPQDAESVHLALMHKVDESIDRQSAEMWWEKIMGLRDEVLRVLEGLRQEQKIASNQEASVTVYCGDEQLGAILEEFGLEQFAALCIVSEVKLQKAVGETTVAAEKSSHQKCQRCWNYWPSVGADSEYNDLCKRCVEVIRNIA